MKGRILLLFLVISISKSYSQSALQIDSLNALNSEICEYDKNIADADITKSKIKFFCYGSIIPVAFTNKDEVFEREFKLKYIQLGCQPFSFTCMIEYNQAIAKYLDNKYGLNWREKARKDIYGVTK